MIFNLMKNKIKKPGGYLIFEGWVNQKYIFNIAWPECVLDVFKFGQYWTGWGAWFLKLLCQFVYVCVCLHSQGYQYLVEFGMTLTLYDWLDKFRAFIWQLQLVLVVVVTLVLMYFAETNLLTVGQCYISHYFHFNSCLKW